MTSSEAKSFTSGAVFLALLVRLGWQALRIERTRTWPKTWATIDSAKMEAMELDEKTDTVSPSFAFSHAASGENHTGRFSLFTGGQEVGESMAKEMLKCRASCKITFRT